MVDASYVALHASGELARRAEQAAHRLLACDLCPRDCAKDRRVERGECQTGLHARVTSAHPHYGEESPLVGRGGSGTIFITYCNLNCVFCQNWETSHLGEGHEVSARELARAMLKLQQMGCHNINFVTPTHVVPQILAALGHAAERGLRVPLVYNTGGYDRVETLALLDGVVDIYMPDLKFLSAASAQKYCGAEDYPEAARAAIAEMHRQVGDLAIDDDGVAVRGLLVRHLVMPGHLEDTRAIMRFLATEISPQTYVNVMDQYRPCGEAHHHPELARQLSVEAHEEAIQAALDAGLTRLDDRYRPGIRRLFSPF